MTTLSYERDGKKYEAIVEELPATAVAYLLQYGWAQSLQDSIAGRAKAVLQEIEDSERAKIIEAAKPNDPDPAEVNSEIGQFMVMFAAEHRKAVLADIEGQLNKRADAIKAGTVGARVSTPRDAFESMCVKIAGEMLSAALKAKGLKRPEKDKAEALVKDIRAKRADKIESEAKRRIEAASAIELDI